MAIKSKKKNKKEETAEKSEKTGKAERMTFKQGVALVSGCSPRIFSMLKSGILSPLGYMLDILGAERYEKIAA